MSSWHVRPVKWAISPTTTAGWGKKAAGNAYGVKAPAREGVCGACDVKASWNAWGGASALASPVARGSVAPLPDALDMGGGGAVSAVAGRRSPAVWAGGVAGLPARQLGTVALAPGTARGRRKEGLTGLARALGAWTSHEPASPQAHDLPSVAETAETGGDKRGPKNREADGRRGEIC